MVMDFSCIVISGKSKRFKAPMKAVYAGIEVMFCVSLYRRYAKGDFINETWY